MPFTLEQRAEWRRRNRARRVEIDGRLVAAYLPEERHGGAWADHGCQCEPCSAANKAHSAASAKRRRARWYARRALVNGVLVSPDVRQHGTTRAYKHFGCRCASCGEAERVGKIETGRVRRAEIRARRVMRDAHWFSPDTPRHGTWTSYSYYGCRCVPCREHHNTHQRQRKTS